MKYPVRQRICIVADGPSAECLRDRPIPQSVYVIGVNHASIWLPRCNAYVTSSPDPRQRFVMQNKRPCVRYFAAVPANYGSVFAPGDHAGPREDNVSFLTATEHMEDDPRTLAGCNSVYTALHLAMRMQARRVAIIGMDANDRPRVSGGRPAGLEFLPELMERFAGRCDVINGSVSSRVEAFKRTTATSAIDWLL